MVGSQTVFVGLALALALAGTGPPAAAGDCDRARSILAERDRTGDIAATRPRRECTQAPSTAVAEPGRRPIRRDPVVHRGSPFIGFGSDPLAYSSGFHPSPPRP